MESAGLAPSVTDVTAANLDRAEAFLARHANTTLFLAANLARFGSRTTEAINSGNFKLVERGVETLGVFCLTRRGNLLAETGGRTEFAQLILDACDAEPITIRGVVGEWRLASALWRILTEPGVVNEQFASREQLYRLALPPESSQPLRNRRVRRLVAGDFERWQPLSDAYMTELGLPQQIPAERRRTEFSDKAGAGHWWGLFEDDELLAIGGLNAVHRSTGQIGGVYTVPEQRRRGLGRALMRSLIADSNEVHGLDKLVLFTGEADVPAQRLYESLGFEQIGEFGLLFGSPVAATDGATPG